MSKDKVFGLVICIVGALLIVFYSFWGVGSLILEGPGLNPDAIENSALQAIYKIPLMSWTWAVVLPLWLIVVLIGIIAIWIGFSMLTTPPPVPLEELEEELEAEEAASKGADKKEEKK